MKLISASLLLLSLSAYGQHSDQPVKESTTDLRTKDLVLSVEIIKEKKTLQMEKTPNSDFFMRVIDDGKESVKKISSREGSKLDLSFASHFLKCQYELVSADGECIVKYRLYLKGEKQDICEKDDKKTQEILAFIDSFNKYL